MARGQRWFAYTNLIISLGVVAVVVWALLNRQGIIDWWRLQSFKPSSEIMLIANNDTMVGHGRDLFYASQPAIESGSAFNANCVNNSEQSIVLGCYRAQSIYIFDVTDPRLDGVKEVTAAHEMLHAAYERMNEADKQHVNALLDPIIKNMTDPRMLGLIQLYNKSEPGELYNEMHSILGTEVRNLSPELETYYQQYFSDREKIVTYSENYEAVFSASKQRISDMDSQLTAWKAQIDTNNDTLQRQQAQLAAESQNLSALRSEGKTDEYNAAVPGYNQQVESFNTLVQQTKQLIAQYNALVDTRNKEAAAQNNLYQSLDSRYQSVQAN